MKHPSDQEWMAWLYGEASRAEKNRLAAHLKVCGECRAEVGRWERTRAALDLGKVHESPARAPLPWLKWGIAAALLLVAGFGVGRRTSPAAAEVRAMRASLKEELHAELSAELAAYKTDAEQKSAQDNKLILAALSKSDADRLADYALLHKELETVAVLTQNSFQQTQQQIVTLANYSEPGDKPSQQ